MYCIVISIPFGDLLMFSRRLSGSENFHLDPPSDHHYNPPCSEEAALPPPNWPSYVCKPVVRCSNSLSESWPCTAVGMKSVA